MFGSYVNHDQHSQDNVQESRTHPANNITCDFPTNDTTQTTTLDVDFSYCWLNLEVKL